MQTIKRNKIVFLDMTVFDENGLLVETTRNQGAFCYLHGRGNLLPSLESALDGQPQGFETELMLQPKNAFGKRHMDLVINVPLQQIPGEVSIKRGERVQINGFEGVVSFVIQENKGNNVVLDANHPLAGKALKFSLKVKAIRDARRDEVKHRRPYPGGHHLMVTDSVGQVMSEQCTQEVL